MSFDFPTQQTPPYLTHLFSMFLSFLLNVCFINILAGRELVVMRAQHVTTLAMNFEHHEIKAKMNIPLFFLCIHHKQTRRQPNKLFLMKEWK